MTIRGWSSGVQYDDWTNINFKLNILTSDLDRTKLIGQLAYQARVVTFAIRADTIFRHGTAIGLRLTCTMLGFDLGYTGP